MGATPNIRANFILNVSRQFDGRPCLRGPSCHFTFFAPDEVVPDIDISGWRPIFCFSGLVGLPERVLMLSEKDVYL